MTLQSIYVNLQKDLKKNKKTGALRPILCHDFYEFKTTFINNKSYLPKGVKNFKKEQQRLL